MQNIPGKSAKRRNLIICIIIARDNASGRKVSLLQRRTLLIGAVHKIIGARVYKIKREPAVSAFTPLHRYLFL